MHLKTELELNKHSQSAKKITTKISLVAKANDRGFEHKHMFSRYANEDDYMRINRKLDNFYNKL